MKSCDRCRKPHKQKHDTLCHECRKYASDIPTEIWNATDTVVQKDIPAESVTYGDPSTGAAFTINMPFEIPAHHIRVRTYTEPTDDRSGNRPPFA